MASVKLIKKIMEILEPEGWDDLTDEEYEDFKADVLDIIDAVEDHNSITKRLLVVGQIQHKGSEKVHTVALGPYGARGVLSDEEKFRKAADASTAVHEAGGKLAWDTTTRMGTGRYMVVPLFRTPRDAWDFYRGDIPGPALIEYLDHADQTVVPACVCGMKPQRKCHRHLEKS